MIVSTEFLPILEAHRAACEQEVAATRILLSALQSGVREEAELNQLLNNMTAAHDKAMELPDYQDSSATPVRSVAV